MSGGPPAPWPTARTAVAGVVGSPVRHSLSPALHNAAFRALGLDWAYLAFEVATGEAATAIAGARALGLRGLSVTMPHKPAAFAAAEPADEAVRWLRAANTLVFTPEGARAHDTDGPGFLDALAAAGVDPRRRRCLILGAGGAARAVARALHAAGAGTITVWARRTEAARWVADLDGFPARGTPETAAAGADLLVNATPVGMDGVDLATVRIDPEVLRPAQVVVDLVYGPRQTLLVRAATTAGAQVMDGLPMLVHQAARQFELWTGLAAPLDAMWEAVGGQPSR